MVVQIVQVERKIDHFIGYLQLLQIKEGNRGIDN